MLQGDPAPESSPMGRVKALARARGLSVLGVAPPAPLPEDLARLTAWREAGHGEGLDWLTRNPPQRADPRTLHKTVRSIVVVAVAYATSAPPFEAEGRYGRVARYAWGRDYHVVLRDRLRALALDLRTAFGCRRTYVAVDDAPLLERAVAHRAGLGFVGKNTCLIAPGRGSWFLLGEVLLDVDLPPTGPREEGGCGGCVRCLDACPTGAFPAPFVLDAPRCLSYLTIEHRGAIPEDLRPRLGPWVFGCDVCQEVCPWQRPPEEDPWPEFAPEAGVGPRLDLAETLALTTDAAFAARFAGTPLVRAGREGLLRNAAVVARNVHATSAVPALRAAAAGDPSPLVREHAAWAMAGF